jgi:hypothetical protein
MIKAFHDQGGVIRKRVACVKAVASIFTLGAGGAGGREGPTMQIGGALGSLVALGLRVGRRERRILMVAGVAAGMSAVFRTPLSAALLATECSTATTSRPTLWCPRSSPASSRTRCSSRSTASRRGEDRHHLTHPGHGRQRARFRAVDGTSGLFV